MADVDFIPGYRIDRENVALLTEQSCSLPAFATQAPQPISRRSWLRPRQQGAMGSCTGFARATCSKILNYVDTLNRFGSPEVIELSAMFAYLTNQRECGLIGRDQGATISGALQAAQKWGDCREELFPYPDPVRYSIAMPEDAVSEGAEHQTLKHLRPKRVQQLFQWHQTGLGCTLIGVPWTKRMAQSRGVWTIDDVSGPSMGGHALCLTGGHSETLVDRDGLPYLEGINSHGAGYGDGGFFYVEPRCVDFWIASRFAEVICVTDIEEGFQPRKPTPDWGAVWQVDTTAPAQSQLDFGAAWRDQS